MALPLRTVETNQFYSAAEFMALPLDKDKHYELVRGIIPVMTDPVYCAKNWKIIDWPDGIWFG